MMMLQSQISDLIVKQFRLEESAVNVEELF